MKPLETPLGPLVENDQASGHPGPKEVHKWLSKNENKPGRLPRYVPDKFGSIGPVILDRRDPSSPHL